jgi:hypothetical protein
MKKIALVAAIVLSAAAPAIACAPAPSCWMRSGSSYLRSVCHGYAGQGLKDITASLDEPEKAPAFIKACARLGVRLGK